MGLYYKNQKKAPTEVIVLGEGDYVQYSEQTGKTDSEKQIARTNIGAVSLSDVNEKINTAITPIQSDIVDIKASIEDTQQIVTTETAKTAKLQEDVSKLQEDVTTLDNQSVLYVQYDLQDGKTETEKQNARTNIGAVSLNDVKSEISSEVQSEIAIASTNYVQYITQTKTDAEKQIARTNIGAITLAEVQSNANIFTAKQTIQNDLDVTGDINLTNAYDQKIKVPVLSLLNTDAGGSYDIDCGVDGLFINERPKYGSSASYNLSDVYRNFSTVQTDVKNLKSDMTEVGTDIESLQTSVANSVQYVTQTKTDSEKQIARTNIGAVTLAEVQSEIQSSVQSEVQAELASISNNFVQYTLQSGKTETEKQYARTNIGAITLAEVQSNTNIFTAKQTIQNDLDITGKSTSNSFVSKLSYTLNGDTVTTKFYSENDEIFVEEAKSVGGADYYNISNIYKNFIDMSPVLLHSGNVSSGTISMPTLSQYKYINIIAVNEKSEYASYIWQYDNREYTKMINSSTKDVNRYVGFRIYSDGIGITFHENMSIAEIYGLGK